MKINLQLNILTHEHVHVLILAKIIKSTFFRRFDNEHDDRGGGMDKGHIRNRLGPKKVGFDVGPRGGGIHKRSYRENDKRQMNNRFHMLAGMLSYVLSKYYYQP